MPKLSKDDMLKLERITQKLHCFSHYAYPSLDTVVRDYSELDGFLEKFIQEKEPIITQLTDAEILTVRIERLAYGTLMEKRHATGTFNDSEVLKIAKEIVTFLDSVVDNIETERHLTLTKKERKMKKLKAPTELMGKLENICQPLLKYTFYADNGFHRIINWYFGCDRIEIVSSLAEEISRNAFINRGSFSDEEYEEIVRVTKDVIVLLDSVYFGDDSCVSKLTPLSKITALSRKNVRETNFYKECMKRIEQDCSDKHEVKFSGYGDDYILTYARAYLIREALEQDGFTVVMSQVQGSSKSNQKGERDGTFELTISGWI